MVYYWLLLAVLAVWRITHLLAAEDGPWDVIVRCRRAVGEGFWGTLFDCFHCLSLWVSLPFAIGLGRSWPEMLLLWPALSGAAILLERATSREDEAPPVVYYEDEEGDDGLLR